MMEDWSTWAVESIRVEDMHTSPQGFYSLTWTPTPFPANLADTYRPCPLTPESYSHFIHQTQTEHCNSGSCCLPIDWTRVCDNPEAALSSHSLLPVSSGNGQHWHPNCPLHTQCTVLVALAECYSYRCAHQVPRFFILSLCIVQY